VLVLSRCKDERVVSGDMEITVTIVDIRGDKVRLGFEADPKWKIHREEVYDAIKRQGESLAPDGP